MSLTTDKFSPEIFSSPLRMKQFFQGEAEIAQVKRRMAELYSSPPRPQLLYNKWEVTWIVIKAYGQIPVTVFLHASIYIFKAVGAESLSRRCIIIVKHLEYDQAKLDNFNGYEADFLVPTINCNAKGTEDVYLQPMLPFNKVDNLYNNVLADVHPNRKEGKEGFEFMQPGVCQGIGDWMQFLFSQTQEAATDPKTHLIALTELFSQGASRQASLLQTIYCWKADYLKLQAEENEKLLLTHNELNSDPQRATQAIQGLAPGAYAVYTLRHRMEYFKYSDDLAFIVDSNKGLIAANPQRVLNIVKQYHFRDDPNSQLYVQKMLLPKPISQSVPARVA